MSLSFPSFQHRITDVKSKEEKREGEGTDRPFLLSRRSECAKDSIELFEIILSGHVRYSQHEFCENTACSPIIYSGTVATSAEEELWWSVPSIIDRSQSEWGREG